LGLLLATSYVAWSSHRQRREAELETTKQRNEVHSWVSPWSSPEMKTFYFICMCSGGDDDDHDDDGDGDESIKVVLLVVLIVVCFLQTMQKKSH